MPIRQPQYPIRFTPRGLSDAFDATDTFAGACVSLANLVFNPGNPEIMVSRPGVVPITDFAGFSSPGVVSVQITVNNRTYGMISTALNAGKDEPFCYNHMTGAFEAVSGVTNLNTPTTQATTGAWTPPTMAVIGTTIIVTHPGFAGGGVMVGAFNIATPTAPAWSAGDLTTNALPSVPTAVANYRNRAWYACGQFLVYSDVLVPLTRTNATQVLTIGDTSPITALSGLPVQTTSSGVVGALIAFKDFQTWQITGDAVTLDLSENFLSLTVGTTSPRSVALCPTGLYFSSISGPCFIDQLGSVKALTNSQRDLQSDVRTPFAAATVPSRMCAAYSAGIYRACMETVVLSETVTNDYWFDEHRRRWNGPHTFSYDCASQLGNYFVLCSNASPGALFSSQVVSDASTVFNDNGTAITVTEQSSTFPKTGRMTEKQVVESTLELSVLGNPISYQITGLDDQGNTLNSCQLSVAQTGGLWGAVVWGAFSWAATINRPHVYTVPWTAPLVFKKFALYLTATASGELAIGTFFARYQDCGYMNASPGL